MLTTSETSISISSWKELIQNGKASLKELIENIHDKAAHYKDYNIWIYLMPLEKILLRLQELESMDKSLPLYGVPFAVKDNIDVAHVPTTAGCPAFSYIPEKSAEAVEILEAAGAIMIGKTNMDQFATGLVGTRSPHGAVKNSFNPNYISGGSSSGSAVAVALGMACFSLGTDTAGSGRVPAGFNNIYGVKPTKNTVSTAGIVHACKTLDCVSIFTADLEDAQQIFTLLTPAIKSHQVASPAPSEFTFAVPQKAFMKFFGNEEYESLYYEAVEKFTKLGGKKVEVNFSPFLETSTLLYEGPWVAERLAAIKEFYEKNDTSLLVEIKTIFESAKKFSAVDTFLALYKLEETKLKCDEILSPIDFLLVPTAPTIYKIDEINRHPFGYNRNLGYYTNFVNLLNLCALAIPNGFQSNGLPMGITLIGKAYDDVKLLSYAQLFNT